jgi:hypothetical protein
MQPLLESMGRGWFFTTLAAFSGLLSAVATLVIRLKGTSWRKDRQAHEQECEHKATKGPVPLEE